MTCSMRDLFGRQGIANEVISLRYSLAKHQDGLNLSFRQACDRFLQLANGNGFARGCHRPSQAVAGDLAYVVPSWVAAESQSTRTVEGVLTKSKVTNTDFPLKPWHTYYDWNFHIRVDKQYTYLLSPANHNDFECEWDTAFLPSWAWPQDGDRIWMVGRWIYDCGHPENDKHKTEIHPPKAVVTFRSEAVQFSGNGGPTRATNAVVYIGRNGGYTSQSINDQNYEFDLFLPPKPYEGCEPRWRVQSMTGALPVQPQITAYPAHAPRVLRVVIPLRGLSPQPDQYGAIISGGWSDPRGTESSGIQRVRVRVTKIFMDGDYDTWGDEWYVYVGVNGRWKVYESIGGSSRTLDHTVSLDLHPSDRIHITACGFEADLMHDHMGDNSGYNWAQISAPNMSTSRREEIEDDIFWQLAGSFADENDPIGYLSRFHGATERGSFTQSSQNPTDYRLVYTIENR